MPNVNPHTDTAPSATTGNRSWGCLSILMIILVTMVATVGGTLWLINSRLFASEFEPVTLNAKEETRLNAKIDALGLSSTATDQATDQAADQAAETG